MTDQTRNTLLVVVIVALTAVTLGLVAAIELMGRQPDEIIWTMLTYMLGVISTMVGGVIPTSRGGSGMGPGAVVHQDIPASSAHLVYNATDECATSGCQNQDGPDPSIDGDLMEPAEVAEVEQATLGTLRLVK